MLVLDAPLGRAATLVSPKAVVSSSGPAFPQGRQNGNPPDPQYAAERAIDGDPATFCCLLDDSLTGVGPNTIPARAAAPVTGWMVFDLGQPAVVLGVKLTSRDCPAPMNPKNVDCFYFADDEPATRHLAAAANPDPTVRLLCQGRALPPLRSGASTSVIWDGVVARYLGVRVNDSYESGGGGTHYNFQLAEVQFFAAPLPAGVARGARLPPLYVKRDSLCATLLAARARLVDLGLVPEAKDESAGEPRDDEVLTVVGDQLWQAVRRDFPPLTHRLLEYLPQEWFGARGWLTRPAQHTTELEQRLIRQAIAETRAIGNAGLESELHDLIQSPTVPDDPRWLDLSRRAAELARLLTESDRLQRAVVDLSKTFPERYAGAEFRRRVEDYQQRLLRANRERIDTFEASLPGWREELAQLKAAALVRGNPLLSPGRLLFVKRYTYSPGWYYADFMRASRFGGGLCVLSLPDGKVMEIPTGLPNGIYDRCDLSFDGRRIVFGYKAGPGKGFRLYEIGVDGSGLRALTVDPPDEQQRIEKYWHPQYKPAGVYRHHTDDFHPCYLPTGDLCFASTRCERGVLCDQSDSLAVNTLYRLHAGSQRLEMLSQNALSESTPSVMNDGRVLYTRWEYVDKGVIAVQALWAMHPDGSGTREVYGNDIELPPVLIQARAIPGQSQRFVCTATMHHPFAVGPILLVDSDRDVRTLDPLRSLTPDTDLGVEGKDGRPHAEHFIHLRNGQWVKDDCGPLFADPYPLCDLQSHAGAGKYFLVACNPDRAWNDPAAYGLYLLDVFGNRVPIYHDPGISCWQPIPLGSRPCPPVVASSRPEPSFAEPAAPHEATLFLSDVYAGLEGIRRGTIKYLRVLEQVPRPWSARRFWPDDSAYGQHAPISLCSHIHVKIQHGVVPVREDGSAHFIVPADKNLFFQALDENYMEVQRMRTFVNLRPGESRSCVGCHEYRPRAPAARLPLALRDAPQRLGPQPGEKVPRPIHYATDVQPILDQHCVRCHSPQRTDGGLDLTGDLTTFFNRSYENLMQKRLLAYIQEFHGPQPDAQVTNAAPVPPRTVGSAASRLIRVLQQGHYDAALSQAEFVRLATWVDANGPYYGSYFGRRNVKYRDDPDFRPVPTLASASGRANP
jgi:hypothetical protein